MGSLSTALLTLPLAAALVATACSAPTDALGHIRPGVAASCSLHDLPLESVEVDVQYGWVLLPSDEERAARERLFPHGLQAPQGGCVVGDETAVVRHCPACTERQAAWSSAQEVGKLLRG